MFSNYLSLISFASLNTIALAIASLVIGMFFALIFVALESTKFKPVSYMASSFIMLLRGLPELLIVLLFYFGSTQLLFMLTDEYIEFSNFWCGSVALALVFAAYASQVLRGAIKAIPNGQWESAYSLGLKPIPTFLQIIVPQMWRHALPGLSNQWLVLLKDTALVSLIGVNDLIRQADLINATTHKPFTWYGIAALYYLAITLISKVIIAQLDKRCTRFEREVA